MLLQLRWMMCLAPLLLLRIARVAGLLLGIPLGRVALLWGALRWDALRWEPRLGRPALLRVTSLGRDRVAGVARVLRRRLLLAGVEAGLGRWVLVTTVRVVSGR